MKWWPPWRRDKPPCDDVKRAEAIKEQAKQDLDGADSALARAKEDHEKAADLREWALRANRANRFDAKLGAALRRSVGGGDG